MGGKRLTARDDVWEASMAKFKEVSGRELHRGIRTRGLTIRRC